MDFKHSAPKTALTDGKPSPPHNPTASSRRRRLWGLGAQTHGPIVGTCWDIHDLKRLIRKTLAEPVLADDYDVHCGTVAECGQRNRLSELLQRDLDHRHARLIRQYRTAKTRDELTLQWKKTLEQGDTAGALWVALTHPQCDDDLEQIICRNMHMFQHHAVFHFQLDQSALSALTHANAHLTQELVRTQERSARFKLEKAGEIERLNSQLADLRAMHIQKDRCIALLNGELVALRAEIPELELNRQLKLRLEEMAMRQIEMEALNNEFHKKPMTVTQPAEPSKMVRRSHEPTREPRRPDNMTFHDPALLQQKTVLCVGGRSGNVASYRTLIERVGGRFAHHDGGREDNANVLHTSLAAADLVICQTGCISHNAYWKVKNFCKRTGKNCVFVENPSVTALARKLEEIAGPVSTTCIELSQRK